MQTVSSTVTKYLLDLQPGLSVVLSQDVGANVTRFIHTPRGIHAQKDQFNNWEWIAQDGLGSVRSVMSNNVDVLWNTNYDGYGNPFGAVGAVQTPYAFTGEMMDASGLLDVRARRYNSTLGVLTSIDQAEGLDNRPMSLNGYSWVEGNVLNAVDPTGRIPCMLCELSLCGSDIEVLRFCKASCGQWVSPVEGTPKYAGGYRYQNLCHESESRLGDGFQNVFYECNGIKTSNERHKERANIYRAGAPATGCQCANVAGTSKSIYHTAVDIDTSTTRINAVGDGNVIVADYHNDYGNHVFIDHGFGILTFYAHLSEMSVAKGDSVKTGQGIGVSGKTGFGSNNQDHLHFEVRTSTL
ncbi:MAG: M23 family metallopeptidase [Chloroflexi bacterium]|nr:M23 family metallopeptidase [Chloroflexota bacterium]MCC6897288.1 peptidoglycan DD-metalloendopeptidase family protein [Anaerolineae bacterium]